MANVLFYLQHSGEEFVTTDYAGRTIRQMFANAIERGGIDNFSMDNVTLSINTRQLGGMDSHAEDIVNRLQQENPDADLDIYVVAIEAAGTKQGGEVNEAYEAAKALAGELQQAGWRLVDEDPSQRSFRFQNVELDRFVTVKVLRDDIVANADVGVPSLIAFIKLKAEADKIVQERSVAATTMPELIAAFAAKLGVAPDQVQVTIIGR